MTALLTDENTFELIGNNPLHWQFPPLSSSPLNTLLFPSHTLPQPLNLLFSITLLDSDVKSSRSKWPWSQNFGLSLGLTDLASASALKLWHRPRSQIFGLGLASISLSYYVIGHFSGKNRVKFGNFVNFSGNNLKSHVVNHYLVLFHNYFLASALASTSRNWPRPRSSGLGCEVLASFNITAHRSPF